MRLLFDQNFFPRLRDLLADLFPGSIHIREVGLQSANDESVRGVGRRSRGQVRKLLAIRYGGRSHARPPVNKSRRPRSGRMAAHKRGNIWLQQRKKCPKLFRSNPMIAPNDEILRELAFARMIERGLEDSQSGRTISDKEMSRRIKSWCK